jgi:hypothetical protein
MAALVLRLAFLVLLLPTVAAAAAREIQRVLLAVLAAEARGPHTQRVGRLQGRLILAVVVAVGLTVGLPLALVVQAS